MSNCKTCNGIGTLENREETGTYAKACPDCALPMPNNHEIRCRIVRKIEEYKSDERYSYPDANVFTNAPLALIQVDLKARVSELERLLKWIDNDE